MKCRIEGAEDSSGNERVVTVEAVTALEAEQFARQQGLLISNISESTEVGESIAPSQPASAAITLEQLPASTIDYRTPQADVDLADVVPDCFGLKFGAIALRIIAGVCFLIGGFVLILGVVSMGSLRGYSIPGILSFVISFLTSLWPFVFGTIFYACAAACDAIRDIARNSFRLRDQKT